MAREYMMYGHPGENHYIITGTHGFHAWMKGKTRNVRVPEFYWKAQCYPGESTWAWVSLKRQKNLRLKYLILGYNDPKRQQQRFC